MITPGFFDDPDIADLTPMARLFFIGLWCQADREGRLVADLRRLKVRIFPFDDVDINALAGELLGKDMVRRYQDDTGTSLFWIRQFTKHQRPHPKEQASLIVPYDKGREKVVPCREKDVPCQPESGVLSLESGVLSLEYSSATVENTVTEPAVLTFSTVGTPSEWHLTQTQIDAWSLAFPQTDVLGEARKALAWVLAKQRKTAKGMPVFLVTWLGKTANGPVRASHRPSPETHGRTGAPARGKYDHIQDA